MAATEAEKRWQREHYDTEKRRERNWKELYGLSREGFELLWDQQGGRCAICSRVLEFGRKASSVHVDHDHLTGKVRGLLCGHCNHALGKFEDDPARLRRAADYLEGNLA